MPKIVLKTKIKAELEVVFDLSRSIDLHKISTQQTNEEALEHDLRLLSSYRTIEGVKLWVITEADRSVTTILLPEEY